MKSLTSKSVVKVADLGITLYPGQTTWVEDEDFNSSQCLRALCSMGKVEVMSKDRHKTMRSQTSSRTNRAARKFKPRVPQVPQVPQVPPNPPEPTITRREAEKRASEAARKAAEEAARMAISAVMPLIQEIKDTVSTQSPVEGIDSKIENAVSRAIEGASFVATEGQPISTRRKAPAAEEPIFIPKGIIKEDSEVLSVNSSSSEDGELDSAVAALKALKKK